MNTEEIKTIYAGTRKEWREWFKKNHSKEKKVYLIKFKKHTGKPSLNNKEAMYEAICFGWIDTTIKRIDEEKYKQCFVKRNKNSKWSNNTLSYAKKMIKEKKMTPAGLNAFKEGLKKPILDHNLPKNPEIPEALKKALEKNKKAKENFNKFAPSYKRFYIYGIELAKRPETKKKRINEVVKRAKENKKPGVE
ncbi:MAG: YdeI/OmpD-associated family protein [Candidatus Diapherotrites archaeon]